MYNIILGNTFLAWSFLVGVPIFFKCHKRQNLFADNIHIDEFVSRKWLVGYMCKPFLDTQVILLKLK
jgi:hypothetical protein